MRILSPPIPGVLQVFENNDFIPTYAGSAAHERQRGDGAASASGGALQQGDEKQGEKPLAARGTWLFTGDAPRGAGGSHVKPRQIEGGEGRVRNGLVRSQSGLGTARGAALCCAGSHGSRAAGPGQGTGSTLSPCYRQGRHQRMVSKNRPAGKEDSALELQLPS